MREKFSVTFFPDRFAKSLTAKEMSLVEIRDLVLTTTANAKNELSLLKLATFGDERSANNSLRHNANVKLISGVELDYDAEEMAFEEAVAVLQRARLMALVYTSPSHSTAKPRWRVILPTSTDLLSSARAWMAGRVNGVLGGVVGTESFTLSQSFYFGKVGDNLDHRAEIITGDFVDLRDDLDAGAIYKASFDRQHTPNDEVTADLEKVAAAVEVITNENRDWPDWNRIAMAIWAATTGSDAGLAMFHAFSEKSTKYNADTTNAKWQQLHASPPSQIGAGTLFFLADEAKPEWRSALDSKEISDINGNHALVLSGNKASVMKLEGGTNFRLLQVNAFKQWFANRRIKVGNKTLSVADHWLGHPQRRQYEGIEFAPGGGRKSYYNLWRGFAVEPREGDCSKFLAHLRDNVAQGNVFLYKWVIGWFAQIMQQQTAKTGTSLALRGKMGVGKTKVGQVFGSLIGDDHYALVADPRYIVGQFNSHMASLLLLHADEAFWAGDKRAEGKLRDLITGHHHFLEFKGVDPIRVRNLVRLFVTGDRDWLVPAGFAERRFAVLDVGDEHMQDIPYFAAIDYEMDHGGREALLDHLLNFDLRGVDLRVIPRTTALLQQQIQSATPEQAWWLDMLQAGRLPQGTDEANTCLKKRLFRRYVYHANLQGVRHKRIETMIGMFLNKYVGSELKSEQRSYRHVTSNGATITKRGYCYVFPALADCRERFAKEMQQEGIAWGSVTEWQHDDEPPDPDDELF
jgi:Primase C terminal 2 (PriCT-2)/Family of unknown function (DUF5906)